MLLTIAVSSSALAADQTSSRDQGPFLPKPVLNGAQSVTDLTGDLEPEDLAQALVGDGVEISNVSFTGDDHAGGTFSGFGAEFTVADGVALSSGSVAGDAVAGYTSNLIGPNQMENVTAMFELPGDPDLDELVAPLATADAAVLEFDFIADGENISFQYVFGSDEYLEFVGSDFNDVFAFFVNGENCALVPDPAGGPDPVPVTINTINKDANPSLFISNSLEDVPPAPINTELDGFTTVLTCAAAVTPGEPNTLKLAIADTSDTSLDSTVLIRAGSLQVNEPPVADDQAVNTAIDTPVDITLTASDPNGDALTFAVDALPEHGELSGEGPDQTYTPDDGFVGTDTFTFTASDGALVSEPATVTITVGAVPTTTLPPTGGGETTPWLAGGAAIALLLGVGLVVVARRRLDA
jgi:hypothetical protein